MTAITDKQRAVLFLAVTDGYVNPASATHARRCGTRLGDLTRMCKTLADAGLMRSISAGRFQITDQGRALVPHTPRRHFDGTEYVEF